MYSDDDSFKIVIILFLLMCGFFGILIVLHFLTTPQTGDIAGYSITMPGIAWMGVPAFAIITLILYVKNRM
jgi:hypothetical protein